MKSICAIGLVLFGLSVIFIYQYIYSSPEISTYITHTLNTQKDAFQSLNQSSSDKLTFERRSQCNYKKKETCHTTNKSLVISFWNEKSKDKWVSQNIISAFPIHSFDHMIFVYDNSSWSSHPAYKHFIWIYVYGQHRLWYLKRFVLPMISKSYAFLWIVDDDAKLNFNPLHYQCVIQTLKIPLSAPARLNGALSHRLTKVNNNFKNQIGRWTDFVETGPIAIASSLAWECIYKYIDAATGTGWGLDLIWCNMIAEECLSSSEHGKACAILDGFTVDHQSVGVNSANDGGPEKYVYTQPYRKWRAKLRNINPLAKDNELMNFCRQ